MSLVRYALRLCAVEALKGRTLVGENVRNSRIGAIDIAADGTLRINEERGFVDVFTDDSTADENIDTRDLRENGMLAMNFETGITTTMVETDEQTAESVIVGVGIPATDDAFEATLDILDNQIVRALTDPENEWAELWRKLSGGVAKIERRRISSQDDGVRRAARQLRITLKAKADPTWGQELVETSPFMRFKALVEDRIPQHAGTVALMMGMEVEGDPVAMIRAAFGQTASEAKALGYALASDAPISGFTIKDARDEPAS
ncbi:hypothetical protein SAMN06297251_102133 [Fulvimarina manganoxydans]|uniref:Uncharacterized protein n=1 Tax=Fulvimarina manganoxydans TaxID=937218 RepID=A0A1W1Z3P6_9HYPH|nr:hypothetical protein [Fulvimarina manganoxydans]SMC43039.1 hypothetical protein SAMN06297251_102133 [Fulvimarina manganoxydans]